MIASRMLVDRLCAEYGIPLLVLHDFDKAGFTIAGTLQRSTWRYQFANDDIRVVDLGLRLHDVNACGLAAEDVCYGKTDPTDNLVQNGATGDEIDFLYRGWDVLRGGHWGQRVELNAFTSDAFIRWIEAKLAEHGVGKILPDAATLERAYRRAAEADYINTHSVQIAEAARTHAAGLAAPADLRDRVLLQLAESPEIPWDHAIGQIVNANGRT